MNKVTKQTKTRGTQVFFNKTCEQKNGKLNKFLLNQVYGWDKIIREVQMKTFKLENNRLNSVREVVSHVIIAMPEQTPFMHERLKKDLEFISFCVLINGSIFKYLDLEQQKILSINFGCLSKDTENISTMSEKELGMAMVTKDHFFLNTVHEKFTHDETFITKAISANPKCASVMPLKFRDDFYFMWKLILVDHTHFKNIGPTLSKNHSFFFECIEIDPCLFLAMRELGDKAKPLLKQALYKFTPGIERAKFLRTLVKYNMKTNPIFLTITAEMLKENFKRLYREWYSVIHGIYKFDRKAASKYKDVVITFSK